MSRLSAVVVAATLATATAQTGCYGSYGAFHAVHRWNGQVSSDSWARSAVHLAMWIVPVYELSIVGDFFIFNTVEQFTGSNPFH